MATGERKFNVGQVEVKRFDRTPIPPGEYELKVKSGWEVRRSDSEKSSQLAYAHGYFEVLGTGKDGGKNRRLYVSFFTDLTPGSDGVAIVTRGGQVVEFCKAIGQAPDFSIIEQKKRIVSDGSYKTVDTLSPKELARFMNYLDGTIVKARIKVEKGLSGEPENKVDYFIESEDTSSGGDEDELDESDEDEEADKDEDKSDPDEDEDEDEDEEEDLPPPPKKSKAIPLGEKKPAKKGKK